MRLSDFIIANMESILNEWQKFAETIIPAEKMNKKELQDHAREMLETVAGELRMPQTREEQLEKSKGRGQRFDHANTAAEKHAANRVLSGFSIEEMVSEYRALRASVLRLWDKSSEGAQQSDLDDMMRFNEAIDQAVAEAVARYSSTVRQSQNLFLGILGHDLRNPLNAITMSSMLLMHDDGLDSKHIRTASRIYDSGMKMEKLVNDMLDFTRTRLGGSIPISPVHTNLAETVRQAVEEIRAIHPDRRVLFEATGDLEGNWDGTRIGQMFSNLIGNAVDHGATAVPIVVAVDGQEQDVVATVHNDDGHVIAPSDIQHIFEPLRQSAATVSNNGRQTHLGLGLYIAREIAHAHGGIITVKSSPGEGTTFTVRLPRR